MEDIRFRIWFIEYDEDGNEIGRGVYHKSYAYSGKAYSVARERYGDRKRFKYEIAPRNPWEKYYRDMYCGVCGSMYSAPENVHGLEFADRLWLTRYNEIGYVDRDISFSGHVCPDCSEKVHAFIESLRGEDRNGRR